ncbi:hypothetical protein CI102_12345 [Trichoderma harzianum]|uniref:Uncharacterized protein n=1 Tax=Trichoderma harzianum CBS 226.95 TaxID=983964 RepID=A0A2T4AN84_TRIHA|nr:hypothetical protein M431DRAFT_490151 [Trichoderma harzianum CBS 226.95]PKK42725.1 hypothetical protein CI102_12345 [Trichoderma harzianum]PTB58533.1 hypothetical protein M431DRAFT_490151 [Trichoderma harzianum CBS 226.95]
MHDPSFVKQPDTALAAATAALRRAGHIGVAFRSPNRLQARMQGRFGCFPLEPKSCRRPGNSFGFLIYGLQFLLSWTAGKKEANLMAEYAQLGWGRNAIYSAITKH